MSFNSFSESHRQVSFGQICLFSNLFSVTVQHLKALMSIQAMWNPANLLNAGVLAKNYFPQGVKSFWDRQKKKKKPKPNNDTLKASSRSDFTEIKAFPEPDIQSILAHLCWPSPSLWCPALGRLHTGRRACSHQSWPPEDLHRCGP